MSGFRITIAACFLLILGVPFLLRGRAGSATRDPDALRLVIVTPHVPQIQQEFEVAFSAWHKRVHGQSVRIDWRVPGGTSEIIKQLESQYTAAAKADKFDFSDVKNPATAAGTIGYDLMMGGGSYDHGRLKSGVRVKLGTEDRTIPMSVPAGFTQTELDGWFGENKIGAQNLYDPQQFWIGTALSSFGIVYNRDVFARLGVPEPTSFEDLTRPELRGWVALADPRQSGSITTTFDAILSYYGWEKGWRVLREMCANTRYFTNASTKPPIDVSQGEAAAGLAIDFYGRGQSQAVLRAGQDPSTSRVGYVDPKGSVYIDADPVSMLRGGPNPGLSKRFIEFCLTEEAQALWQFRSWSNPESSKNPVNAAGERLGPRISELRRLPVRRVMYERYFDQLVDKVQPFELATDVQSRGWRTAIGVMMGAFAIDNAHEQREAWGALIAARRDSAFPRATLEEMERLFYAWPTTRVADGTALEFSAENFKAVRDSWRAPGAADLAAIEYTAFFRSNYRRIVELGKTGSEAAARVQGG